MNTKLIIFLLIVGIFMYTSGGKVENLGSDWFHRGKLTDINQHIQEQVAKAKLLLNTKEGYTNMKTEPLETYNPNKNVISNYSFKTIKPENVDLTISVDDLEDSDFAQPIDYNGEKPLADYLEVSSYDSGSGDLSSLNDAYQLLNSKQYFSTLKQLRLRGGNSAVYRTKPCDPKSTKQQDIIGFL